MDEQAPTSGFLRFWTSIPGILTASAAVITAIGTIYVATLTQSSSSNNSSGPTNNPTSTVTISEPAPQPSDDVNIEQLRLNSVSSNTSSETGVESLIRDCADGDYSACIEILDTLATGCYLGDGQSCDVLYEVSAIGSDYETYGATCGGRAGTEYAGYCRNYDLGS